MVKKKIFYIFNLIIKLSNPKETPEEGDGGPGLEGFGTEDKNKINGFSLIEEILIGVAIASIMMAAMFASYTVVNNTYSRVTDVAGISRSGKNVCRCL